MLTTCAHDYFIYVFFFQQNRWPLKECFQYVQQRRKEIAPNRGFWKQLQALEMQLLGSQSIFDSDLEVQLN
jgi:hypothetical protein